MTLPFAKPVFFRIETCGRQKSRPGETSRLDSSGRGWDNYGPVDLELKPLRRRLWGQEPIVAIGYRTIAGDSLSMVHEEGDRVRFVIAVTGPGKWRSSRPRAVEIPTQTVHHLQVFLRQPASPIGQLSL